MPNTRVIYKYPFPPAAPNGGDFAILVPWEIGDVYAQVVLVAPQQVGDELPTLWVSHRYPFHIYSRRAFSIVATGEAYDLDKCEYIGSAVCLNGAAIWHVVAERL